MPELNLGTELAKRFEEVYRVPQLDVSRLQGIQGVVSSIDSVNMGALKAVYNNAGLNLTSQIVEQANKLNAVCNMSAFNSTGLQELKKIADRYNHISSDFEMEEKDRNLINTTIMKIKLQIKRRMIRIHSRKIVYFNHLKYKVLSSRGDDRCG